MSNTEGAVKDLAEGLYQLARAVEQLAQKEGDSQAVNFARRAKRAGSQHK